MDEFLQWMMPERYWGFKDVGLNILAGGIFLLALWKGIKPKIICMPVRKISVKMLTGIISVDLIFWGVCLSNTPDLVNHYTSTFGILSWLRNEEPMIKSSYDLKIIWTGILITLIIVWVLGRLWKKRLDI
jgi:hypothetical protein